MSSGRNPQRLSNIRPIPKRGSRKAPAQDQSPDYVAYHRSLTDELYAVKDRVRSLVKGNWGPDGESKEVALRSLLRRHLPESLIIGRGFIVTERGRSTQVDILVVDASKPTLFKDGDLLIVTPDAVRAVVEVKTELYSKKDYAGALLKLSEVELTCRRVTQKDLVWTGLFVYEGTPEQHDWILRGFAEAHAGTKRPVNCVSAGPSVFARYWERGDEVNSPEMGPVWHSYELDKVAPSYFVGNLIDSVSNVDNKTASYAWFPALGGKESYRKYYIPQNETEPKTFP